MGASASNAMAVSGETGSSRNDFLDRVLQALNHPLRRRIVLELSRRPASASTLTDLLDEDLWTVSYHLGRVLAKSCDVVEVVEAVQRRGALEKVYALRAEVWTNLFSDATLAGSGCELIAAEVDSAGWARICRARDAFREQVMEAVAASAQSGADREAGAELHEVIVGVAAFPAGAA
jgi:DNA-binding transcriptional ArsR family regulator